jgi:hypothetical protein
VKLPDIVPEVLSAQGPEVAELAPPGVRVQDALVGNSLKPEPDTCTNMSVPELGDRTISGVTVKYEGNDKVPFADRVFPLGLAVTVTLYLASVPTP